MKSPTYNLKTRFIGLALILGIFIAGVSYYTNYQVHSASQENSELLVNHQALEAKLVRVHEALRILEGSIYNYALFLDDMYLERISSNLQIALKSSAELKELSTRKNYISGRIHNLSGNIYEDLVDLEKQIIFLLGLLSSAETRYPAMNILTQQLQPSNDRIRQVLSLAISETEDIKNQSKIEGTILEIFHKIQYNWVQSVSSVRVFVANRSGVFGDPEESMRLNLSDRKIYIDDIKSLLNKLSIFYKKDQLGLLQTEAYEALVTELKFYEENFKKVVDIYFSDQWRSDNVLIRSKLKPRLDKTWEKLHLLQEELRDELRSQINLAMGGQRNLSQFIWLAMLIVYLVIVTLYFFFIFGIRRPIFELAKAMEAEGEGRSYEPSTTINSMETRMLENAFRAMQKQVHTRQKRLESILGNAKDGIITLSEDGTIESFNKSAEELFSYTADEIIGKDIYTIITPEYRGEYRGYMISYREFDRKYLRDDLELEGYRKDKSAFPMLLKVSDMELEGETVYTAIVSDITQQKNMLENLRVLAEHDSLTGLYNRRYFMEDLDRVVAINQREDDYNFALLYIDLDNFKYVNDALGHLAGDSLLVEVTALLDKRARKSDLLARIGGDEFGVILHGVNEETAISTAENFRSKLEDYVFTHKGESVTIGCSIGIAMMDEDIETKEDLLVRADIACNTAKKDGRNLVHLFSSEDQKDITGMYEDIGWRQRIREALDNDMFLLAKQPIVNSSNGEIRSHEILLRMYDGNRVIMPSGLIPAAERFGMMNDIDVWVIKNAIKMLSQTDSDRSYTINLSSNSIGKENVYAAIVTALEKTGVDPSAVVFEITESSAISDLTVATNFLLKLKALGCRTSLDDFGVGYSSFAYLKELPADYVKIDGTFVRNIHKDSLSRAMVKSMTEVSQAMGKQVVAEYVENDEIYQIIREIGVEYCQGYYFGKPEIRESDKSLISSMTAENPDRTSLH